MKAPIKKHLSITKKEWNGMVVLVILILLILAAPYIYQYFHKDNTISFKDFDKDAALLNQPKNTYPASNNENLSDDKLPHPVMSPLILIICR